VSGGRCERTEVRITPRAVVFIATADAIYSLGHGLRTFTAVPRSIQPSTLCGTVQFRGSDVKAPLDSADNDRRWIDLYVCVITGLDLPTHGAEAVLKPNAYSELPSECLSAWR